MTPKLIVVTVNYGCAEAILDGIDETVRQLRELGDAAFWIVDNASPDGSADILEKAIQERGLSDCVRLLRSAQNGGFGAGNNVAIRAGLALDTPPDYFYFLNPDAIPRPGAIAELVRFMDATPQAGIAGAALCDEAGDFSTSFFRFPSLYSEVEAAFDLRPVRWLLRDHRLLLDLPEAPREVDWVTGASFMARAGALESAGPFDEGFFLYWEEVELCHRIWQAGFTIHAVPQAVVMHLGGVSTGMDRPEKRVPEYWFASRAHFFRQTGLVRHKGVMNVLVALGLGVHRLADLLRGRRPNPPHYLKDFIRFSFLRTPRSFP